MWVSSGGVGHVEMSEGFFGLTYFPLMCEGRSSSYGRRTSQVFLWRGGASWARAWWLLVFVLIWFTAMGEIQIMCDMDMDDAGIPMLVTISNE